MKRICGSIPVLTVAAAFALAAPGVRADVLSTTLGPGGTYSSSNTYWYHGTNPPSDPLGISDQVTVEFTPTITAQLSEIDLPLTSDGEDPDATTIALDADNSGTPGTNLEYWYASGFPLLGSTDTIVQRLTAVSDITLISGTEYWIIASPESSTTEATWNQSLLGDVPAYAVLGAPAGNTPPVPEPAPAFLTLSALTGLLALFYLRRRSRA